MSLEAFSLLLSARCLEIPFCFFENGLLPNSLIFDETGVNGLASPNYQPNLFFNNCIEIKSSFLNYFSVKSLCDTIVIPLQLQTDTNLLINSPFQTMSEFLQYALILCRYLGYKNIILRPHPKQPYVHGLSSFVSSNPDLSITCSRSDGVISRLKKQYTVISVNSTVALTSLLQGIPTILFGNTYYGTLLPTQSLDIFNETLLPLRYLHPSVPGYKNIVNTIDGLISASSLFVEDWSDCQPFSFDRYISLASFLDIPTSQYIPKKLNPYLYCPATIKDKVLSKRTWTDLLR